MGKEKEVRRQDPYRAALIQYRRRRLGRVEVLELAGAQAEVPVRDKLGQVRGTMERARE